MAQYTERLWTQTKDTEQLTFIAGVDLPYRELVKESGPNTNIMVVATTVDAIGYVLSPKGVLAGEKVDVQMLYGSPGGGGGGAVDSVTGLAPNVLVDNTDPANPIVSAGTQSWEFSGVISDTIAADQNNYNPPGLATATILRIAATGGPQQISGIAGGTSGRILIINNVGGENIILPNLSGLSLAGNQFILYSAGSLGAIVLPIGSITILVYDGTDSRWRVQRDYIFTDGTSITGTGIPGDPLIAAGGGGVASVTGLAPNVIVDNTDPTNPIVAAGTESWEFSGIITTPILANAQNDYTQAGMANASTIRVFGDFLDPPIFSGLAGGTDGRILLIHNSSQDTPIYFLHNSASSTAANRIMSPGFVVDETFWSLPVNGLAVFQYDATDQRWRVIGNYVYKIIDDGSGVVTVGGDPQFPIVGFNGVFVDGVTITGNGTAGSPLTGSPSSDVLINQTIYVDPTYGNDGTAVPNSMTLKYATIDAALSAWTPGYVIHLFPGVHSMSNIFTVSEVLNIFMEPNATLQINTSGPAFSIDPAQRLHINGYGDLELLADLCVNNAQSRPIPAEAHIQCRNINSGGAGNVFEPTSMIFTVEADGIYDRGFQGRGWCRGKVSVDFWTASTAKMIYLNDFTAANGETKYTDYGPQQFIVKGRNRERCQWENLVAVNQIIYTEQGVEPYKSYLEFNVDFKCVDSFALDPGRGTFVFNGHLHHSKTDTAGNEIPWLYGQQTISDNSIAPIVEHKWGSWISATNSLFAGSLNNELISIAMPGKFIFNGQYENSGLNAGSGAWPILQFSNANPGNGQTTIILNGDFKSGGGDVAPIRIVDIGVTSHTYKFIVKNCLIQTRFDYAIDTNAEMLIYVFHSLTMNQIYNPLITDGMSEDRTMVDKNVEVTVPGYGV